MQEEYYTVKEIAKRLKLSDRFIRAEIARGRLKANFFVREYRISRKDLSAYEKLTHTSNKEDDLIGIGA